MDFRIAEESGASIMLRKNYKLKEALYKNELARCIMEAKAKNPDWRNPDIKAHASNMTYNDQLEMIKAESAYLSKKNLVELLQAQKATLTEESYNSRMEMRKFTS